MLAECSCPVKRCKRTDQSEAFAAMNYIGNEALSYVRGLDGAQTGPVYGDWW